jgi:hypothetical protein
MPDQSKPQNPYLHFYGVSLARVIFPDGTKSRYLATRNAVYDFVNTFLGITLDEEDARRIKQAARQSRMIVQSRKLQKLADILSTALSDLNKETTRLYKEKQRK